MLGGHARPEEDIGGLWYDFRCQLLLNNWFASYAEARAVCKHEATRFLFPYARQVVVGDENFVRMLGSTAAAVGGNPRDLLASYGTPAWRSLCHQRLTGHRGRLPNGRRPAARNLEPHRRPLDDRARGINPRAAFASTVSESHRQMTSLFATSSDGSRIAYERVGSGPAIVLLHGGMQSRQVWHAAGYIRELQSDFTVLAIDVRGHGDSERPRNPTAYSVNRHCDDILAVVDHAGIQRFILWGYSYGANIGRYRAARSQRVLQFVMVGIPFGPGAVGEFRQTITGVRDRWAPILKAQEEGNLDVEALTPPERAYLQAAAPARRWPGCSDAGLGDTDPRHLPCPTLWIVGRENPAALENAQTIGTALQPTNVQLVILDGLSHEAELTAIDLVLPQVRQFLHGEAAVG